MQWERNSDVRCRKVVRQEALVRGGGLGAGPGRPRAAGALSAGSGFSNAGTGAATESSRAGTLLASAHLPSGAGGGRIVWHTDGTSLDDPAVRSAVTGALQEIAGLPGVAAVVDPYTRPTAAAQLNARATVKTHVNRAMVKTGSRDRAQLVIFAYENGLVPGWRSPPR